MEPQIRRATLPDLTLVAPLFDAYREFFAGETDRERTEIFLKERLRCQDSVLLLACEGDRGVGFLQLYPLFSSWYVTRIWFLSDLYVEERYRGAGIGRALVREAQVFAREVGSRSIMVEIPHVEPHLVTFYESLAFERDKDFNLYRCYLER